MLAGWVGSTTEGKFVEGQAVEVCFLERIRGCSFAVLEHEGMSEFSPGVGCPFFVWPSSVCC